MIDQIDIFKSGFVLAFIDQYSEHQNHSYYPDKDRLLYVMCDSEKEKEAVTREQIEIEKKKVKNFGFEELSFAYLLSCRQDSLHNYIEPNHRYDFWINRFAEEFENYFETFKPITEGIIQYNNITELTVESLESESEFWRLYSEDLKPKVQDFLAIITSEAEIVSLVESTIEDYNETEYWDIDFDEFKKYIDVSKPIEILFTLSELLVSLSRIEMFKSFLEEQEIYKKDHSSMVHFDTFSSFLDYFTTRFTDNDIDERYSEAKRLFEQRKLKLENSSFQSEIDEVMELSENALKENKHKLMLSFNNETYKTKFNGGFDPYLIAIGKLYYDYQKLYRDAVSKKNISNSLVSRLPEESNKSATKPFMKNSEDEDSGWFKVGLKFADGTIRRYGMFDRPSYDKLTVDAGLPKTLRVYVSDTYNNRENGKSIFMNKKQMTKIYNYCTLNKIVISQWFLDEYRKFDY